MDVLKPFLYYVYFIYTILYIDATNNDFICVFRYRWASSLCYVYYESLKIRNIENKEQSHSLLRHIFTQYSRNLGKAA